MDAIEALEQEIVAERKASDARSAAAQEIASGAYYMAVDQQASYPSLSYALDCYLENAIDTAIEQGVDCDSVSNWFWRFVDGGVK